MKIIHAKWYMRNGTCEMLLAKCYMQNATCKMLYAKCYMRNATCEMLHATWATILGYLRQLSQTILGNYDDF